MEMIIKWNSSVPLVVEVYSNLLGIVIITNDSYLNYWLKKIQNKQRSLTFKFLRGVSPAPLPLRTWSLLNCFFLN
jgi:hypothetical protein